MKKPNPQGKGLVPMLESWQAICPGNTRARDRGELLLDYLVGLLVLSARFRFAPVVGQSYYLYWRDGEWILSLVAPAEWGARCPGAPVGEVLLREDRSWQMRPDAAVCECTGLVVALEEFQQGFAEMLDTSQPLAEGLPYHVASLPWYPRLLALALSKTLASSLDRMGALNQSGRALLDSASPPLFLPHIDAGHAKPSVE
jgi:hypothetical protein